MKKLFTLLCIFSLTSFAINNAKAQVCDTLSNVASIGPGGFVAYVNPVSGGYISGHNGFGDISKADFFANNTPNTDVMGAFFFFAVAQFGSPNSTITAAVWDNSGVNGSPGSILTSETVLISDIALDIANTLPTFVQFNTPATVSGNFYVGITFGYAPGDTVALFTDTIGSNTPTGWEEWDPTFGGGWYSYNDPNSWGIDIAHLILPVVCYASQPCSTITVSVDSVLNTISCVTPDGMIAVSASGGAAPYGYSWSNGQSGASIMGLSPGIYDVTATDQDGCTGTASVTIADNTNAPTVTASATNESAAGANDGTATASATGGTPGYSYLWSDSSTAPTIGGLTAGIYTVTVTDQAGCTATASATVFATPSGFCDTLSNVPVIGPGSVVVYLSPNGGYLAGHNNYGDMSKADYFTNSTPNAEVTGAFYFFGVAEFANASSSITAAVWDNSGSGGSPGSMIASESVLISDIAQNVAASAPTFVLFDPPATVSGNYYVGVTFNYVPGDTIALFTDTIGSNTPTAWEEWGGGGGWFAYSDSNGWGIDIAHLILPVICASTPPCPGITVNTVSVNGVTNCANPNGSVTVAASGGATPYTYAWSNGDTGDSLSGLANGVIDVTATDQNACTGTASITISDNTSSPSVTTSVTHETASGANDGTAAATATGGTASYSYSWSNGGATQAIGGLNPGTYTVTATDQLGCTGTASAIVQAGSVGIGDATVMHSIALYPNPASGEIHLRLELKQTEEISIMWYNVLGIKVMETANHRAKSLEQNFDLSSFPKGVYLARIKVGTEEVAKQVTVVR